MLAACSHNDTKPPPTGSCSPISRVSVGPSGAQGNGASGWTGAPAIQAVAISSDGRFVAFASPASNLIAGDTNGAVDVFVNDRSTGATTRVSVASDGTQANAGSFDPSISADGRFVAYWSAASNLVSGDTNGSVDVFVHDRSTGETTRASVSSAGVAGNGHSFYPSISSSGRFVAFTSEATNLVAGDTNGQTDVFVRDRDTGTTLRASVASDGSEANGLLWTLRPGISGDGSRVAFSSEATNLVAGDTNGQVDVFVRDLGANTTVRANVSSAGAQADGSSDFDPTLSSTGRFVAFTSDATNLVPGDTNGSLDAFVRDLDLGQTTRVSLTSAGGEIPGGAGGFVDISGDGSSVAFVSNDGGVVPGDANGLWDVFVRSGGTTRRLSLGESGAEPNASAFNPALSADGAHLAFWSAATNLVASDTNYAADVFVTSVCAP
jgi:WD40-like Beta Propeller Repeat